MGFFALFFLVLIAATGLQSVLFVYPLVRIVRRTGHSGWWVLLALIPGVNIILLWVFAFVDWPAVITQRSPE